jgi:peptide/nickel transport system permease protein
VNLVHGDLGSSLIDGHAIGHDLLSRLPVTASITILATLVSAVVGVSFGVLAAIRGGRLDRGINVSSGVVLSLPPFWLGVVLVYVFAVSMKLLPATGYVAPGQSITGWLESIALPVLALSVAPAALVARIARVAMIRALQEPHIHMLRSLGEPPWRLILVHALRTASAPIVSVVGVQFVGLFSGSVIIESLFGLPGLGQAATVGLHDVPAVEGVVVLAAVVVVLVNFALDVLLAVLDPRVRAA